MEDLVDFMFQEEIPVLPLRCLKNVIYPIKLDLHLFSPTKIGVRHLLPGVKKIGTWHLFF
jgi:hypothetical protein